MLYETRIQEDELAFTIDHQTFVVHIPEYEESDSMTRTQYYEWWKKQFRAAIDRMLQKHTEAYREKILFLTRLAEMHGANPRP